MQTGDRSTGAGGARRRDEPLDEDVRVGGQVAVQRRLRGLTQEELAAEASVSVSYLRKIEQGSRPATRTLISALARALGVDVTVLTGQPYVTGDRRTDAVHDLIPALRGELAAYRLPPIEEHPVPALVELQAMTDEVSQLRHRVDLFGLGRRLPEVLAALRFASHAHTGGSRERVMALLAEVYYAVRQFLHKLGYLDLAALVADRYEWAAAGSDDPQALALAEVFRAGELDRAGDWRGARAVMTGAVDSFDLTRAGAATWSVWGFLHLMSAYMCAHAGDEAACWAYYAEAEEAARRLGEDRDDYRLAFGPTNAAIWGTALAVELMDGAKAVERAGHVHLAGQVPPERAGHHWLDLARGQLLYGKRQDALDSLMEARRVAPQQLRYHPMARETLYVLARYERRTSERLRELATWMGLDG